MGCGPSHDTDPRQMGTAKIRIYGDNFDADSRALQALCEVANIEAHYEDCNVFSGEKSRKTEFQERNPTGTIPFLEDKDSLVLAEGYQNFAYILTRHNLVEEYGPRAEIEKEFSAISKYFFKEVRAKTSQLIMRKSLKILDPSKLPKDQDKANKRKEEMFTALETLLLPELDRQMKEGNDYLVGNKLTALDIITYMELNQIQVLYNWTLPQNLAKLSTWYDTMNENKTMSKYTNKLAEVLEAHPELKESS